LPWKRKAISANRSSSNQTYSSLSLKEIGKIFDMDYTAVCQAVRRFEKSIKSDDKIRKKLASLLE